MNTKNRIAAIRLHEKLEQRPEYAEKLGVSIRVKPTDTTKNVKKGVSIWQSGKSEAIVG